MISYGRYRGSFNSDGDFVATSRPGGHRVAVNAAIAGGGLQILGTRDPWAAEGTDDQQEAFRTMLLTFAKVCRGESGVDAFLSEAFSTE